MYNLTEKLIWRICEHKVHLARLNKIKFKKDTTITKLALHCQSQGCSSDMNFLWTGFVIFERHNRFTCFWPISWFVWMFWKSHLCNSQSDHIRVQWGNFWKWSFSIIAVISGSLFRSNPNGNPCVVKSWTVHSCLHLFEEKLNHGGSLICIPPFSLLERIWEILLPREKRGEEIWQIHLLGGIHANQQFKDYGRHFWRPSLQNYHPISLWHTI